MTGVKQDFLAASVDQYVSPAQSSRCLLLAIVDRALRDLHPRACHVERSNALAWLTFEGDVSPGELRFTYKQIADLLEFSASERAYIQRKVNAAKYGVGLDTVFELEPMHRHRSWV